MKNLKTILTKILIISIIFTSLALSNIYASSAFSRDQMELEIQQWIDNATKKINKYEYEEEGETVQFYAAQMPDLEKNSNIGFDSVAGSYIYYVKDEAGNIVDHIPFDVNVLLTTSDFPNDLTSENYGEYMAEGQEGVVLETTDGEYLKTIELTSEDPCKFMYVVDFGDGEILKSTVMENVTPTKKDGSFWDGIKNFFSWVFDQITSAISGLFNKLLLLIADGIQNLIDGIFGSSEKLTLYKIIFNKVDKLSINFWGQDVIVEDDTGIVDSAPATTLKSIVNYWYNALRGIAIAVYLVMLLYIGVRILLSSTTKSGEKYKDMLTSWVLGIVILCFYHYVMRYTVIINDTFVQMVDEGSNIESTSDSNDAMLEIRNRAETENNIALTIVYIIMLGQLIVLLGVYYKRIFMMAFLITIFPVVATLFIWEKTKGGAKALTTWTKEFVVLVLTQTFHAVVYVVLVDGALKAFNTSGNWFVFIISVLFLFEAEKIIRTIFSMKSSANTIGDLASAGVAAWATAKTVKSVFKTDSKSKSQDETDKEEATKTVDEARRTTAVNNSVHQQSTTTSMITNMTSGNYNSTTLTGGNTSPNNASSGSGSGGNVNNTENDENNQMDNWTAAQSLIRQEALGKKTKHSILSKAASAATHTLTRGAGVTLGLASGLASGSMKEGLKNAAIGNELGGTLGKGVTSIGGWVKNAYAGRRLKAKVRSGALDKKLREVGFDLSAKFDENEEVSNARAKLLREALAREISATTRGGSAKGELKALKTIDKGRKREEKKKN